LSLFNPSHSLFNLLYFRFPLISNICVCSACVVTSTEIIAGKPGNVGRYQNSVSIERGNARFHIRFYRRNRMMRQQLIYNINVCSSSPLSSGLDFTQPLEETCIRFWL
jgi:hypothetical protein